MLPAKGVEEGDQSDQSMSKKTLILRDEQDLLFKEKCQENVDNLLSIERSKKIFNIASACIWRVLIDSSEELYRLVPDLM